MEWLKYCKTFITPIQNEYRRRMHRQLDILHPVTFTEKLQYLKVFDSTFLKTFCADKIKLHEYCRHKLGKDICIPILAIYDTPEQIEWDKLPDKFVIKCNHGSGFNIIVRDKYTADKESICKRLATWLKKDYGMLGYELHYCLIPRKILIEEFKEMNGMSDLVDYKLFCYNGVPKFWQVITDRHTDEKISHYDMTWNYTPEYDWAKYKSSSNISQPSHYDEMVYIANILSADFKFVRVDFYVIDDVVYLGELTFTPADGFQHFKYADCDIKLGNMLKL